MDSSTKYLRMIGKGNKMDLAVENLSSRICGRPSAHTHQGKSSNIDVKLCRSANPLQHLCWNSLFFVDSVQIRGFGWCEIF